VLDQPSRPEAVRVLSDGAEAFEELRRAALNCVACDLAGTRANVVFGVGDRGARLMLVGEAPGKNEDLQGEPFVGAAGRLLDELLAEVGIAREEVYIANVLKCRPPGNRDPRPAEIDACRGYLREQIRLIAPEVVMTLGAFASRLLLGVETGVTRLRGRRYDWWLGAALVPTFHPSAALRGGERVKAQIREDLALVSEILASPKEAPSPPAGGSAEGRPTEGGLAEEGAPRQESLFE